MLEHNSKHFNVQHPLAAAVAELGLASAAFHVVAAVFFSGCKPIHDTAVYTQI